MPQNPILRIEAPTLHAFPDMAEKRTDFRFGSGVLLGGSGDVVSRAP